MEGTSESTPSEVELLGYYSDIMPSTPPLGPLDLIEPELDDPMHIAERYYREDNRPVLASKPSDPQ